MWRIRTLLRMVDAWMTVAASKGLLFVLLLTFSILPLSSSSLEPIEQSTGTSMSSEGSINFQTAKGFATMLSLEARKANSSSGSPERNRRTLLGDSRMALHDDLLSKGYFTSKLFIGTPPAEFALIVDTGRTITYMPCSTCTHYGHHQDAAFSPSASSTYESIPCTSPLCNAGFYGANKGNFTGLIVEEASARCDIDAYYSINANHFDVCRPVSTVCGSFLRLSDLIATVLHKAALVELVELKRSSGEQALEEAKERTRFNW